MAFIGCPPFVVLSAVDGPRFYYSEGSFFTYIITIGLPLNSSPSEWFSVCKNMGATPLSREQTLRPFSAGQDT